MLSLHQVMVFSFLKPKACCMTSLHSSARYRWSYVIPRCTASSTSQSGISCRSSDLVEKEYADLQLKSLYAPSDVRAFFHSSLLFRFKNLFHELSYRTSKCHVFCVYVHSKIKTISKYHLYPFSLILFESPTTLLFFNIHI